ncbi:g1630 [Coccomyxa elongata]
MPEELPPRSAAPSHRPPQPRPRPIPRLSISHPFRLQLSLSLLMDKDSSGCFQQRHSAGSAQQINALNAQLEEALGQLHEAARQRQEAAVHRERLKAELAMATGGTSQLRRQGCEHEEKVMALLLQLHDARDKLADA